MKPTFDKAWRKVRNATKRVSEGARKETGGQKKQKHLVDISASTYRSFGSAKQSDQQQQ
jgi:hypothetical protein